MAIKSKEFGERLKERIYILYPSAANFAARVGLKPQSLQNFLNGRVPDPVRLREFAEALNVTQHWLLTGEENEPPPYQQKEVAEDEGDYRARPLATAEEQEYLDKLLVVLRNPATKKAIEDSIDAFLKVPRENS